MSSVPPTYLRVKKQGKDRKKNEGSIKGLKRSLKGSKKDKIVRLS
jgi:hypothetical protein